MIIEKLTGRIAELEQSMQQLMANYNACLGAKQECESWLKKLEEKEEVIVSDNK